MLAASAGLRTRPVRVNSNKMTLIARSGYHVIYGESFAESTDDITEYTIAFARYMCGEPATLHDGYCRRIK